MRTASSAPRSTSPRGHACPIIGHALASVSRGTVLELADEVVLNLDAELSDTQIKALVPGLVARHLGPEIEKAAREVVMMLTGRVD